MVTSIFDANRLLTPPDETTRLALAYLAGEIWHGGEGWVGPRLQSADPLSTAYESEVKRALVATNLIRDLVGRHAAAVVGREPAWEYPVPASDVESLTRWWDATILPTPAETDPLTTGGVLGLALSRALCGEVPVVRHRVRSLPFRPATLDDALARIAIEVLPQAQAAVLDLDDGKIGVVRYDAVARTLASRLGRVVAQEVAEVVTLDENGRTVIRTVGMTQTEATSDPLPLNGHLTLYAMTTPRLVTDALLGLQRRATATLTGMGRNTDTAGFAEVTYLNADRPGQWVNDPASPTGQRFEATPLTLGPGYRLWLRGLDTGDGYTTPAMNVREPTPPAAFTETIAVIVDTAYREARQLHALMGSDATASGESRRQALADFEASLGPSARSVEALTRWVIETTYALALALMGRSAPADVRCTARCNLSGMLMPVEELKERREAVGAGLLARPTYQAAAGIDDPAAEDALIEAQEGDASNGDAE